LGRIEDLMVATCAGELDVAVLYDKGELDDFGRHVLYRPHAYAYFGAEHPLAGRDRVRLAELASPPLVLLDRQPSTRHTMGTFALHGLVPRIRHRTQDFELTRSIVARSATEYGIFVQRPAGRVSYDGLPIVEIELDPPPPAATVVLAWPRE